MFKVNETQWPLVIFEFNGLASLTEHKQMLKIWDQLFLRQQKFIAIRLFNDDTALKNPPGIGKLTQDWLDSGAGQSIKTWVIAMLNITPESSYERMKNLSVEKVFEVPGGIFKSTHDASQWITDNVDPSFVSIMKSTLNE